MMGMTLLLVSLSVLFISGILVFLLIKLKAQAWPPAGWPGTPPLIWLNTAGLISCSATIHGALSNARGGRTGAARFMLGVTMLLGCAFLAGQAVVWKFILSGGTAAWKNMFAFAFYFLSGLHAAHLIGGLIFLGVTILNTTKVEAAASGKIKYCAIYWHFLDVTWLVLFFILFIL